MLNFRPVKNLFRKHTSSPDYITVELGRPTGIVVLFGAVLIFSTCIWYLGYRYMELTSEYRMRNFQHLSSVNQALDLMERSPILRGEHIREVRNFVLIAREQAAWCTDNLSDIERMLFEALGGTRALEICAVDVANADWALKILEKIEEPETIYLSGPKSAFARALQLEEVLRVMRSEGESFHPHVNHIEARMSRIVKNVVGVGTFVLFSSLVLISVRLLRGWQRQVEQAAEVRKSHARYQAGISASREGFALINSAGYIMACNDNFRRFSSPFPETVQPGMNVVSMFRQAVMANHYQNVKPENADDFVRSHMEWMQKPNPGRRFDLSNDTFVDVKVNTTEEGDKVVIINDVTEYLKTNRALQNQAEMLAKANDQIEFRALHDPLTELANRRYLDREIAAASNSGPVTILHLDLDRFKQINDLMGHSAGDFVLKHVAKVLKSSSRAEDLVARIGGDEFAILCRQGTLERDATGIAERILGQLQQPLFYQEKRCDLGTSIGIAVSDDQEDDPQELLNNADAALYEAKETGRGKFCFFTPVLRERIRKERELTKAIHTALREGEFVPYYQTQHSAQDWTVSGVEVLARWKHPELGLLSPDRFLHIARQMGLENDLDAAIFDRAILDIAELDRAGIYIPSVSFNVSAGRILDPEFIKNARAKIPRPRDRIAFEILETVSVEDLGEPLKFAIDNLRDLGFRIEIDDFGSGHASIKSVLDINPQKLKIDRSLVQPLGRDLSASQMITSIIEIGNSIGVSITAEGVETEEQAKILADLGCDTLQGFYFSKPAPLAELKAFIETRKTDVA